MAKVGSEEVALTIRLCLDQQLRQFTDQPAGNVVPKAPSTLGGTSTGRFYELVRCAPWIP